MFLIGAATFILVLGIPTPTAEADPPNRPYKFGYRVPGHQHRHEIKGMLNR